MFIFISLLFGFMAEAQVEHRLVRRVVVFPFKIDKEYSKASEEAWWQVREALTEGQRFLVASKNFLMQKDVFQARSELTPADAIILGKLLDAQAIVTTFLLDRVFSMRVYEGEYGRLLWQQDLTLHPSQPISDQLPTLAKKMIQDFISLLPYQGFVFVDPLKGKAIYEDQGEQFVRVDVGTRAQVGVGDAVQLFRLYHDTIKPLFLSGVNPEVIAEGVVVAVEREGLTVKISRRAATQKINEFCLVRLPREHQRLREVFGMSRDPRPTIGVEYFSPEMTPTKEVVAERKPLVTALTFLANLAAFLLLAF